MIGRRPGSLESVQKKLHVLDWTMGFSAIAWGIYDKLNPWWIGGGILCILAAWWNPVPKFQNWITGKFIQRPASQTSTPVASTSDYAEVTVTAKYGKTQGLTPKA
ncbi:MAG: hypothetical protein U9N14_02435 [Pseudomonadota bacterium]|nr:hypothetical protein [Pseudomonadota bacterium]